MNVKKSIFLIALIFMVTDGPAQSSGNDFSGFWKQFRKAALKYDYKVLGGMMRFPFEVEKEESEVVRKYNESQLPRFFEKIMMQSVYDYDGEKEVKITLYDQILGLSDVDVGEENIASISIGQFVFMYIDEKWLLVKIYLA